MTFTRVPGFNSEAAEDVRGRVAKMAPAEAVMFVRMLALEGMDYDRSVYGDVIAKAERAVVAKRLERVRAQLVDEAIAKAAAHEDTSEVEHAWAQLELLAKADSPFGSHADLSRRAKLRARDLQTGQFQRESRQIDYEGTLPISREEAEQLGIPPHKAAGKAAGRDVNQLSTITPEQRQAYRQAYLQVADMVHGYRGDPSAFLLADYGDEDMPEVHPLPADGALPLDPLRELQSASVHVVPRSRTAMVGTQLGRTQGTPDAARRTASDFANHWERKEGDEFDTSAMAFRRLAAGSALLSDTIGDALPPHGKLALKAGAYAGSFGPEAQRVIQPVADKSAYRYRGTERHVVDPKLAAALRENAKLTPLVPQREDPQAAFESKVAQNKRTFENKVAETKRLTTLPRGKKPQAVPAYADVTGELEPSERARRADSNARRENILAANRAAANNQGISALEARRRIRTAEAERKAADAVAREQLGEGQRRVRVGSAREGARVRGRRRQTAVHGYEGADKKFREGPVLNYFRGLLPAVNLATLQVKSGVVPPSQGVILDAHGKVAVQAVGYGEDWYVPFNLKNLQSLKGGEYIRTRTFGGLTPEDIYTGLASGARAVTVVSHSGTFTMEFDDSFTGGRRYNDKAARMVNRYAKLLDAVRSGDITIKSSDPDLERSLEERAEAISPYASSPKAYSATLGKLRRELLTKPALSQTKAGEVTEQFLAETAGERGQTPDDLAREAATKAALAEASVVQEANRRDMAVWEHYAAAHPNEARQMTPPTPAPVPPLDQLVNSEIDRMRALGPVEGGAAVAQALGLGPQLADRLKAEAKVVASEAQALSLNGRGYATAMTALQEQFPYYIRPPQYHAWPQEGEPFRHDTGYIRPFHNRPAEALAGYFDPHVTPGSGAKVAADSTRHQEKTIRPDRSSEGGADAANSPDRPPGSGPAGAQATPDPAAVARLKVAAAKDLLTDLHGLTFKPGAEYKGIKVEGTDPKGLHDQPGFPPELSPIFSPISGLFTRLDDPTQAAAVLADLDKAVAFLKRQPLLNFNQDKMATYERGGLPATAASVEDWRALIGNPQLDRRFPGPAYNDAEKPTVEQIKLAYAHPEIQAAVKAGLPDSPEWSPASWDAAAKLERHLAGESAGVDQLLASGNTRDARAREAVLEPQAKGLARARQLARNHGKALQRDREADLHRAANADINEVRVVDPNGQPVERRPEHDDQVRRLGLTS